MRTCLFKVLGSQEGTVLRSQFFRFCMLAALVASACLFLAYPVICVVCMLLQCCVFSVDVASPLPCSVFFYLRALQLQTSTPGGSNLILVALMLPRHSFVLCFFCLRDVHLQKSTSGGSKIDPRGLQNWALEAPKSSPGGPGRGSLPGRLLWGPEGLRRP